MKYISLSKARIKYRQISLKRAKRLNKRRIVPLLIPSWEIMEMLHFLLVCIQICNINCALIPAVPRCHHRNCAPLIKLLLYLNMNVNSSNYCYTWIWISTYQITAILEYEYPLIKLLLCLNMNIHSSNYCYTWIWISTHQITAILE